MLRDEEALTNKPQAIRGTEPGNQHIGKGYQYETFAQAEDKPMHS